ncbi:MAG TPA: hypothetical protein VKT18_09105, partial [Acidimicrobiales bacterium]|nr:hypothetical protein [Acidimicrobiales bacterium]
MIARVAVRRRRYERLALVLALVIAVTVTTVALRDAAARSPRSPEAGGPGRERLSLPEMCGSTTPLTRRDSRVEAGLETWTIRTSGWHGARTVEVVAGPASSGDLFGGRDDSAVVPVTCSNDGGTADGQLLFAEVVYRRVRGRLLPVAVLTPRVTGRYPAHVPLQELTDVAPGRIVTTEAFYGPGDATCCATGLATTTWLFRDGEVFSRSKVVRAPYGARHGSRAPRRVPRAMVLVRESSP